MNRFLTRITLVLGLAYTAPMAVAEPLSVWAAASMKTAMDDVVDKWKGKLRLVYAGTPTLARQIAAGAPADVFISANVDWMEHLVARDVVAAKDVQDVLTNRLVLIAPQSGLVDLRALDVTQALAQGRFAIPMTSAVPAGIYGREALETLGLWSIVETRLVETENVRKTLALVARGEVPIGLVYLSDAMAEPKVHVVAEISPKTHADIRYVAAPLGANPKALKFLEYLKSEDVQKRFKSHGFGREDR